MSRVLVTAGLLALSATGCAVRSGAYLEPAAPGAYYGGDVAVAPYVAPVWREPVVVVHPRDYGPRISYRAARHYAYRGAHHRW